jgi:hypothetical protein
MDDPIQIERISNSKGQTKPVISKARIAAITQHSSPNNFEHTCDMLRHTASSCRLDRRELRTMQRKHCKFRHTLHTGENDAETDGS